jgi:hypothetical protein
VQFSDQWPTLVAVVVGAVLSYLASGLTERGRWRRQLSVRWDERRLTAYVDYANTAKQIALVSSRMLSARGFVGSIRPIDHSEGVDLLSQAESDRSVKYEALLLLGDTATIGSAQALNETLWTLEAYATGDATVDAEVWSEAFARYRRARARFYQHARANMGVHHADIPFDVIRSQDGPKPPGSLAATGTD